jgi:hypothetical protein
MDAPPASVDADADAGVTSVTSPPTPVLVYPVFRKTFHVPRAWLQDEDMAYLVHHWYARDSAAEAFLKISSHLKRLGYMEDNDRMIHDYLHYMLQNLLDVNGEVYITEDVIRGNAAVRQLLGGTTPDFVLKKNGTRAKTTIVDIYVGKQPVSDIKGKYKALTFFADFCVVTQHDFSRQLRAVLPERDIDYLYKNFQVFLTEYHYWRACLELQRVSFNDAENVALRALPDLAPELDVERAQFLANLAAYGQSVAAQEDI